MIYSRELKERTLKAFEGDMAAGILRKPELEEKILAYYRKTTPSLQEFYSRYTPEWDAFYSCLQLPVPALVEYLRQMRGAFQKRYALAELNIEYYIRHLSDAWEYRGEGEELKELFLDKWFALLNRKEYDYQFQHIETLCNDFYLIQRKGGHQADNDAYHSRVEWLLHTNPEMKSELLVYERTMKNHPAIRQLIQLLGKRSKENLKYDSASGINKTLLVSHATHSDITGITQGDNLNSLLPIEYCYMADDVLRPVFLERFAEKRLQVFDYKSEQTTSNKDGKEKVSGQGPFIVCVDTSGSMQGERERLAKSAILAIALLTEKTHRKCYVINFSDEAVSLLIEDLGRDMPKLAEFLSQSFHGGTDIAPALNEALHVIVGNDFRDSDVVLISDFEIPPMGYHLSEKVLRMKARKTTFYGLVFGNQPESEYLNLCERYWEM